MNIMPICLSYKNSAFGKQNQSKQSGEKEPNNYEFNDMFIKSVYNYLKERHVAPNSPEEMTKGHIVLYFAMKAQDVVNENDPTINEYA